MSWTQGLSYVLTHFFPAISITNKESYSLPNLEGHDSVSTLLFCGAWKVTGKGRGRRAGNTKISFRAAAQPNGRLQSQTWFCMKTSTFFFIEHILPSAKCDHFCQRPPKQLNHSSFAGTNNIMQFQCLLHPNSHMWWPLDYCSKRIWQGLAAIRVQSSWIPHPPYSHPL